jgi:hypothetical protein
MKRYLGTVLKEIRILKDIDEILRKGREWLNTVKGSTKESD